MPHFLQLPSQPNPDPQHPREIQGLLSHLRSFRSLLHPAKPLIFLKRVTYQAPNLKTIFKIHFDRYVCTVTFLKDNYHGKLVPKGGVTISPGVTWQRLETFLVVETGQGVITGSGWRPGMLLHVLDWTVPLPPRRTLPQMLTVPRLRTRVQTTGFGVRQVGFNHGCFSLALRPFT